MTQIAILMTTFNRVETTLACLEKLSDQLNSDLYRAKIYLTDDKSPDNTASRIQEIFPEVKVIEGTGDLFWGGGTRRSWQEAVKEDDYDYFLWLNDDSILKPNAIEILMIDAKMMDEPAIIAGAFVDSSGKIAYGGKNRPGNFRIMPDGKPEKCKYINGNLTLIPSAIFQKIGYNSERLSHGMGDEDYGLRAIEAGFNCYVSSEVVGSCDRNGDKPRWKDPCLSLGQRMKYFNKKNTLPLNEYFYFRNRHFGLMSACYGIVEAYALLLFPNISNLKK